MPKLIDTFSSNSLKVLDRSKEEFENKYIYNLSLYKKDQRAKKGENFHALISYWIKNLDTENVEMELDQKDKNTWEKLKNILKAKKENFIYSEYSFLVKDKLNDWNYYLQGRYDAIYKDNDSYIIYDWKTLNIPFNAEYDLQTIVYLYCASKIFNSKNIKMRYLSIEKLEFYDINFKDEIYYKNIIDNIIKKLF